MASKGINKVIIVGNLGKDPEVRYTQAGKAVAAFSVATSDSWKDQGGQIQERTEWHNIVIWGKLAEIAGEHLRKGSQVYLEGQLRTRKWQDKAGADRYSTEVVLDGYSAVMQMLGGKQDNVRPPSAQQQQPQRQHNLNKPPIDKNNFSQPDKEFDDDIPF